MHILDLDTLMVGIEYYVPLVTFPWPAIFFQVHPLSHLNIHHIFLCVYLESTLSVQPLTFLGS